MRLRAGLAAGQSRVSTRFAPPPKSIDGGKAPDPRLMRRAILLALAAAALACGPRAARPGGGAAGSSPAPGVEVVIVSPPDGSAEPSYGLVTERRAIELAAGESILAWDGAARGVDSASVTFRSFTDPDGTAVLAQALAWNPATGGLLEERIGAPVTVYTDREELRGTLLAADAQGLTLASAAGRTQVVPRRSVRAVAVAGGAPPSGVPALVFRLRARRAGRHVVEVTYRTSGLSWRPDHRLVLAGTVADAEQDAELAGWATVANATGVPFADARLELVADPALAPPPSAPPDPYGGAVVPSKPVARPSTRHPIGQRVTLAPGATIQVALGDGPAQVRVRRVLRYEPSGTAPALYDLNLIPELGMRSQPEVLVVVAFEVDRPLAPGHISVLGRTAPDEELLLVADAQTHGAPAGTTVRLEVGRSPTLSGARRQLGFRGDGGKKVVESFETVVRNDGSADEEVVIVEHLSRTTRGKAAGADFTDGDAAERAVELRLKVPARGTARVRYRIEYAW